MMKRLQTLPGVLILALLLAACRPQSAPAATPVDVEMAVRVEPEPPAVGDSTLIVTLSDASASPIDGATLQVHGNMDHAGMLAIDREVNESINGEYRVPFAWSMGGGWIVTITAQLPDNGGEVIKSFDFFVEAVSGESIINRPNSADVDAEATVSP